MERLLFLKYRYYMLTRSNDVHRVLGLGLFVLALFITQAAVTSAATTATLLPIGEGTNLSWTPKSGATHYTMVDDSTCNGTTDYVSETSLGERDSFSVSLSSIPDGSTITTIALTPCASRNSSGGGSATLNVFYRFNGTASADAGAYSLTGTTPANLATTNFSALSLAKNTGSNLEVGSVYSAGTKGARLSRLATVITYTEPVAPATPSYLNSFVATSSVVYLNWGNVANETGYSLERSVDGVSFSVIATTSANVAGYTDTAVTSGTYYYKVRAYNTVGYSGYSSTTVATLP
jgi:hypothetical protein